MAFRCSSAFIVESLTQELAVSYGFLGENRQWKNPGCHMLPLTHLDTYYIVLPQCQTTNGVGVKLSYDILIFPRSSPRLSITINFMSCAVQESALLSRRGPCTCSRARVSANQKSWIKLDQRDRLSSQLGHPTRNGTDMNYISWITCSIPPHTQPKKKRPSLHVLTRPRCRNLSARWFREQGMEISKIFLAARLGDNVALFLMPEQQCTNDLHTFYYWNYVCIYVSMYLCIYVSMYLCIYVSMYLCIYVSMYLCIYVSIYLSIYVSIYVCMYVCVYVCMNEWMYVCMYECMNAWMNEWMKEWRNEGRINDWLIDWLIGWLIEWMNDKAWMIKHEW